MSQHLAHDLHALRLRVRRDTALSASARLLFEDICDLAMRDGLCVARPSFFAGEYDVAAKTVERWIVELRGAGYVESVELATDRRRKGLRPVWEAKPANPEVKRDGGGKKGTKASPIPEMGDDNLPHSGTMGDEKLPQLGDVSVPAPRVTPPEGGENGARAYTREGDPDPTRRAPQLAEVLASAQIQGLPEQHAREFFAHYEGQGWLTSGNMPVRGWQAKLKAWSARQPEFDSKRRRSGDDERTGAIRRLTDEVL